MSSPDVLLRYAKLNCVVHISEMIDPWYIAVEPFGPLAGKKWTNYVRWSRLNQLEELVSFDNLLCPCAITELTDRDWDFNVTEDYTLFFFFDFNNRVFSAKR